MTGIISSSSPFLGRAFDDKRNDNAKRKEARTGIRQELSHWRLSTPVLVALDDHWETWCRLNEYSCKATPFASTGNMISADWLKWLMNCGHMVSGHLTAGTRETWDAWLALLRGINSSEITPELIAKLKQEERALRPLLKQHLPPNHRTFVFHLLPHIIRDVEYLGPVRCFWCFRGERFVGGQAKRIQSYRNTAAIMTNNILMGSFYRTAIGLTAQTDAYLEEVKRKNPAKKRRSAEKLLMLRSGAKI
jgi:hypothetical protein